MTAISSPACAVQQAAAAAATAALDRQHHAVVEGQTDRELADEMERHWAAL